MRALIFYKYWESLFEVVLNSGLVGLQFHLKALEFRVEHPGAVLAP
jgi:hypothetical protein